MPRRFSRSSASSFPCCDQDRAVLILDVWNPYLSEAEQALIAQSFVVADAKRGGQRKG